MMGWRQLDQGALLPTGPICSTSAYTVLPPTSGLKLLTPVSDVRTSGRFRH